MGRSWIRLKFSNMSEDFFKKVGACSDWDSARCWLCSDAMAELGIDIGDPVSVRADQAEYICSCWPAHHWGRERFIQFSCAVSRESTLYTESCPNLTSACVKPLKTRTFKE